MVTLVRDKKELIPQNGLTFRRWRRSRCCSDLKPWRWRWRRCRAWWTAPWRDQRPEKPRLRWSSARCCSSPICRGRWWTSWSTRRRSPYTLAPRRRRRRWSRWRESICWSDALRLDQWYCAKPGRPERREKVWVTMSSYLRWSIGIYIHVSLQPIGITYNES